MQAEPGRKKYSSSGSQKKKSRKKIKRPWTRAKQPRDDEEDTATPNDNVLSLSANSPTENDEEGKEETGEEKSVGEAGWTPTAQPKTKVKGKKKTQEKKKRDKDKEKPSSAAEEVLSILLQEDNAPAAPKADTQIAKKDLKRKQDLAAKRTRALSANISSPDRSKPFNPPPSFFDSTSDESESTEESSSSSESEGPDSLDFENLRKYPKSVLRTFCKSQHIPVEAKKRKQKSKQDYINALLAYNKEGSPSKKKSNLKTREGRNIPSNTRAKKESPFYRPTSPHGSRYLASSQPAYLPSFARGMSEEELLAIAVEESLREHAKEQQKREKDGDDGEKTKPVQVVDEAKEKGEKRGDGEDSGSDDDGSDKEKEKETKEVTATTTTGKKSGGQPRWMSRSMDAKKEKKKKGGSNIEGALDGAQFDSDEAFARALQRQLQREADLSDTDSDEDDDEDDDDEEEVDEFEVRRILDRSQGLMYMLELLAQQRGRTLGVTPPPYLANDASFHGPSMTSMLRGPRSLGSQFQDIDPDNMTYEELLELGERIGEVKKKGATQSMITGNSQAFSYRAPKADEERKENSRCPICLTDFEEGEEVRMLPCIHLYHVVCIDKWLQLKSTCCVCQRPLGGSQL